VTGGLTRVVSAVVIALRAVRRNKLRAALTILGITIGIAAVVTVTALATGARENINSQISNLGSNALIVFARSVRASGARTGQGSRLSELDSAALVRDSTSIRAAAPFLRAGGQVIYEGQNSKASIIGSRVSYFEIRNWKVTNGELWSATAESVSEKVVVIGVQTAKDLFGSLDPVGRTVRIGRHPYRVIGVLEEKGPSPFGQSQDDIVLMPITTMRSHILVTRPFEIHAIMMSATSAETTERAKRQAESILRQRHRIGIRMAIGAREADILTQFLLEALTLATLGGLVGTAFGYGIILAFSKALDWSMKLEPTALAVALGTSSVIGLVFGFFPARRAARMDPVQALGRE
jgi:putative ABC transport system permease protein